MNYRASLHTVSGVKVGLYRPRVDTGPTVLFLGRSPELWYGTLPSAQARTLVNNGYWVATVATPNWGNQTDLDNIEIALGWLQDYWGRDTSRVVVIAHEAGAPAALNWGRPNPERIASMSLLAPVIDLETHYDRTPADRSSMEAAYGGSFAAFRGAMPAWNPARQQRRYELRDFIGDRMRVWASPSEPTTPAFIRLPGGSNNNVFAVNQSRFDIVGDIDVRWFGSANNWATGAEQTLVAKWTSTGNQRAWRLHLMADGSLRGQISANGSAISSLVATAAPSVVNGQDHGLGFSWQQATGVMTFYESSDGETWTQLGSTQTALAGQAIFVSTAQLEVGQFNGSTGTGFTPLNGSVKKVEIRGETELGQGAQLISQVDFSNKESGTRFVPDDEGQFVWRLRGTSQLLGGAVSEEFAEATRADRSVLSDPDPIQANPAAIVDPAVATDEEWTQQPGLRQWARWTAYRMDNTLTTDWCGADGNHSIPLPDGRTLWTFSDTFTGSVNTDGSRSSAVMIHNSLVIEQADGSLGPTLHASGSNGASLVPPEPNRYYWINDGVIEQEGGQDVIRLFTYNSELLGGGNWTIHDIDLLTLNASTFEVLDRKQIPYGANEILWLRFLQQPDWTYIYGMHRDWIIDKPKIARAPTGQLTGDWEFWNGSGWSASQDDAVWMKDIDGNDIIGSGGAAYADGRYLIYGKLSPLFGDTVEGWWSANPQGPWTHYLSVPIPEQGAERFGGNTTTYGPTIHPQLSSAPDRLMLALSTNAWQSGTKADGQGYSLNTIDASIYQPRFFEVPLP